MKRAAVVAALIFSACPKPAEPPQEDRLLAKLKAEQERERREGAHPGVPMPDFHNPNFNTGEDPLAKVAAEPPVAVNELKLPEKIDFQAGTLNVRLNGASTSQSLAGTKVRLSTNEQFLRIDLKLRAAETMDFDFSAAAVKAGDEVFPLARDAQRIVGTRNLARSINGGESVETVLMFELPDAALAKGVTLQLPLSPPLEVPLQ